MEEAETKQKLSGEGIKAFISSIISTPQQIGFEVYVITKSEPRLKRMAFYENSKNNLHHKLKDSIVKVLSKRYNSDEAEYVSVDHIADEQRKFYIIPTSPEEYDPLAVLRTKPGVFSKDEIGDATGIAFCICHEDKKLWAYQHLWNIMVPNKSKKNILAKLISGNEGDVFEEMTDPIITFTEKIDLLVIDDNIIATDYKLLQNFFGFQDYIKIRAKKAIAAVEAIELVTNIEKLTEYVQRDNGTRYAKKLMRIVDSKVLQMPPDKLWENIHKSTRWNDKIKEIEKDKKIVLETFKHVEILIDLLDERYTRSDITGEEYDTEVKRLAKPVQSN